MNNWWARSSDDTIWWYFGWRTIESAGVFNKADHHLLRKKVCQRISVMKTNTASFVVFMTKHKLKCQLSGITEILWQTFWHNKWQFVFDVVKDYIKLCQLKIVQCTDLKKNGLYGFQYPRPHTKRQVLPNIKVMKYCLALPNIYDQFFMLSEIKITHPACTKYNISSFQHSHSDIILSCLVLLQVTKYFGLVQIFCARQKDGLHSVMLVFVPAQKFLKRHH